MALVKDFDAYLAVVDGTDHSFYAQFNKTDTLRFVILVYDDTKAIACGAIREYNTDSIEIKRMYVRPENRGKGIATQVLNALENWAVELSFAKCILETSIRQPEAIALYEKMGYHRIPNYGQYASMESSVCFEKKLN